MSRRHDPVLDAIRGVAILLVLLFHLRVATGSATLDQLLLPLVDCGWVGVDLFFVLSGFLVGGIIIAEAESPKGFRRTRFLIRRAWRLWPVLYLYLATMLLVGGASAWPKVMPVLLHIQNFDPASPSHLWSLAVEEHFYLAAAFGLPWLLGKGGPKALAAVLIGILAGCLLLRVGALAWGVAPNDVQWQTPYRIDALAAGVLLAWVERYRPSVLVVVQGRRLMYSLAAMVGFALLASTTSLAVRYGPGLSLAWLSGAVLIAALRGTAVPRPLAPAVATLATLGTISYAVYVWHVSLMRVADVTGPLFGLDSAPLASAWRYGVAIAGGWLIALLVERPFLAWRRQWDGRDQAGSHRTDNVIATANSYR